MSIGQPNHIYYRIAGLGLSAEPTILLNLTPAVTSVQFDVEVLHTGSRPANKTSERERQQDSIRAGKGGKGKLSYG